MTAAGQEPAPRPQQPQAAAPPKRDATPPAPGVRVTPDPAHDDHAVDEPGYGHGV